jgi:hypothetical protein
MAGQVMGSPDQLWAELVPYNHTITTQLCSRVKELLFRVLYARRAVHRFRLVGAQITEPSGIKAGVECGDTLTVRWALFF